MGTAHDQDAFLIFRCFARPKEVNGADGYEAVCIDLSLITWRPTLGEARASLNQAIEGYLKVAADRSASLEDFKHRVNRPVPFYPLRAEFYKLVLMSSLRRATVSRRPSTVYDEQRPYPTLAAA